MRADLARTFARLADRLTDGLFGTRCWSCEQRTPGSPLCLSCAHRFPVEGPICGRCGEPVAQAIAECGRCRGRRRQKLTDHFAAARSAYWLDPTAHDLLHLFKHTPRIELRRIFRTWVDSAISTASFADLPPTAPLIALPLHPRRYRQRGFNFSDFIVDWRMADGTRPEAPGHLVKCRSTPPQSTLGARERIRNLSGSFAWRGEKATAAILVDDVFTTGSTLNAAAYCLRRAGWRDVYAWTLFRTPRRGEFLT